MNSFWIHIREPHTAENSLAMGGLRGQGVVMSNYGLLLRDHVTLRCRSIDRIFLQAHVSSLFLRLDQKIPNLSLLRTE